MGTTTRPVTDKAEASQGPQLEAEELAEAIGQSRARIDGTLGELHGQLNPRILKEEVLQQYQEGKDAIKEDLQIEFHEAKAAISAEFSETKERMIESAKTEIADAKSALREATVGKVETMVQNTQDSVRSASRTLVTSIKENPVPVALIGVGLIWLIQNSRSESHASSRGPLLGDGSSKWQRDDDGSVGDAAHRAGGKISRAAHAAGEATRDVATSVKDSVSEAAQKASSGVSEFAHDAGAAGKRLGHRAETFFDESPLAVGAAVLVAGALVGLAIPITRKETAWMGDARDNLTDRAGRMAQKAGAELHDGAEKAAADLRQTIERKANGNGVSGSQRA